MDTHSINTDMLIAFITFPHLSIETAALHIAIDALVNRTYRVNFAFLQKNPFVAKRENRSNIMTDKNDCSAGA